jgi:hypothetical protein
MPKGDDRSPPPPAGPHQRRGCHDQEEEAAGQRQQAGEGQRMDAGLGKVGEPDPDADGQEEEPGGGCGGTTAPRRPPPEQEDKAGEQDGHTEEAEDLPGEGPVPGDDEQQAGAGQRGGAGHCRPQRHGSGGWHGRVRQPWPRGRGNGHSRAHLRAGPITRPLPTVRAGATAPLGPSVTTPFGGRRPG